MLTPAQCSWLENGFGDRVTFDRTEREMYSHDIAVLPRLLKPLLGSTVPDAVVQPQSEEELVALVRWASAEGVPLTPRGKATSGYGGVLPVKAGVVVDFLRLCHIVDMDVTALTVTVEAGVTWDRLDRELTAQGLTLRLYPTSYYGSTVGGWLAQGGAGIGSYEAGWFRDNVLAARVVRADGMVEDVADEALDLVSDAEGTTGLIAQVTVRVQPQETIDVVAMGCAGPAEVQRLMQAAVDEGLPIWSMSFVNPTMATLRNEVPMSQRRGQMLEEREPLPEVYIVTLAFRARDGDAVRSRIAAVVAACEGEVLADHVARYEWEHRLELMRVKRLGPSLVPAEAVVPLAALGDTLAAIDRKVAQPVVEEGVVIRHGAGGEPEVVLLGFIPSDQRKVSYSFVYALSLTMMRIAEQHGGRPYATGLYLASKARKVLGADRAARMAALKASVDPAGILNPRKVLANGLMGTVFRIASAFEPLMRPFTRRVVTHIGESPTTSKRGIPADVAWYAYSCAQCGACVDACDQFYGRGWESQSPRGKWYWLRMYMEGRAEWNPKVADTLLACTTCELCDARCPLALPIEASWMRLRGWLVHERQGSTLPAFDLMAAGLRGSNNVWLGPRAERASWFPPDLLDRHGPSHRAKMLYVAGCTASYLEQDVAVGAVRLLDAVGVDFVSLGDDEPCCGMPMLVAGKWDLFEDLMRRNLEAVRNAGADTVVTSCPSCDMMWRHVYPVWARRLGLNCDIAVRHYSEIVAERLGAGEFAFPAGSCEPARVTWHDSCHLGRVSGIYDAPRRILAAMPHVSLVEMNHARGEAHCCGNVITLINDPAVAARVGKVVLDEAVATGAEALVSLCPCCELQFRIAAKANGVPIQVVDLANLAASALGFELPSVEHTVAEQWAAFDALRPRMAPDRLAALVRAAEDGVPLRELGKTAGEDG